MVDQRRYKFGQQMITYGDMIFNICLVRVENFHVPTLFSGLLNINFDTFIENLDSVEHDTYHKTSY